MHILLFDIDGTLIRSGGAGKAAMELALGSEFSITRILDRVSYSGRTDHAISADLLHLHEIEPSIENMRRLREAYLHHLPECLRVYPGSVLPGVLALLDDLRTDPNIKLGLLTGNIRAGGERKLRHYHLWDYFAFGGFADDLADRDDVARHALRETCRHLQCEIDPRQVWVIGDTPFDVRCARAIGANAVGVATGWHSIDELEESKPDHLLTDLRDPGILLRHWGRTR